MNNSNPHQKPRYQVLANERIPAKLNTAAQWAIRLDVATKTFGLAALCGGILGFLYLLMYCLTEGLPVPVSLSQLPFLLLALTGIGTAITIIVVGFTILPAWERVGMFGNGLTIFLSDARNTAKPADRSCTLFVMAVPAPIFLLSAWLSCGLILDWPWWVLWSVLWIGPMIIFLLISSVRSAVKKPDQLKVYGALVPLAFGIFIWLMTFSLFLLRGLASIAPQMNLYLGLAFHLVGLVLILVLATWLVLGNRDGKISDETWVAVGIMLVCMPPFIQPIGAKVAENSLKILQIGGGFTTQFILKPDAASLLPAELVNSSNQKPLTSVPLQVGIIAGDDYWVKPLGSDNAKWFDLRKEYTVMQETGYFNKILP